MVSVESLAWIELASRFWAGCAQWVGGQGSETTEGSATTLVCKQGCNLGRL